MTLTQQKPREVLATTYLGQHPTGHTSITSQTIQPYPCTIPLLGPPLLGFLTPNSSPPTKGGGTCTFIGKYSNGGA